MNQNKLSYIFNDLWPIICGIVFSILLVVSLFTDESDSIIPMVGLWANIIILEVRHQNKKN